MLMNTPPRRLSPKMFSEETGISVRHSAYHFTELADAGCIVLVDTKQRRGATEHIYEPLERALAWTSEWRDLAPELKRAVLDSVMGGAVEALGEAIDGGTFDAHDDSHLSWSTIQVDKAGWSEMATILDEAVERLLQIEEEASNRIEAGGDPFLASYFLASFESPRKAGRAADLQPGAKEDQIQSRPPKDKSRLKRQAARRELDEQQVMAKAMSHSTRVQILMAMNTPRRRLSPKMFSDETGLPITHCSYHFRELEDTGCIALVDTKKRRGAIEKIYEPLKTALQWTDDWKLLGPAIRQRFVASVMRGAVEALGEAIDDGSFEARDDSHLSWSTIKMDMEGWQELAKALDRALADLLDAEKKALQRIVGGAEYFVASYFLSSFEAPRRPSESNAG
jgi:hypothetical protein